MKVLLLKPCWPYPISREESTYNRIWPPISLAYSAALLEEAGVEVSLLDAHAERLSGERLKPRLKNFDKIFITSSDVDRWLCPNLNLTPVIEAAQLARTFTSELFLMGQHGTVHPERMLELTGAKAVIQGEPEFAVRDLCLFDRLEAVPGISYWQNGKTASSPARGLHPLDELPTPAWHRLPMDRYFYEILGERFALLETARGCPFQCTFCAKEIMYGPGLRRRSLDRVLNDLDLLVTRHGVRSIYFFDLEFLVNKRTVEQLCDALIQRDYPIRWCCQTRVTDVDKEILRKMRQAGCRLIHFGLESGSQRILDHIKKEASLADAERAIRLTREASLESLCFFMLGFEGEAGEEIQETIRFARKLNPTYASFHVTSSHRAIEPHLTGSQQFLALPETDRSFDRNLKRTVRRATRSFYLSPRSLGNRLRLLGAADWRTGLAQLRLFQGYLASSG